LICLGYTLKKTTTILLQIAQTRFFCLSRTANITSAGWRDRGDMSPGAGGRKCAFIHEEYSLYYKLSKYCSHHTSITHNNTQRFLRVSRMSND
jgi:hypothetical protein